MTLKLPGFCRRVPDLFVAGLLEHFLDLTFHILLEVLDREARWGLARRVVLERLQERTSLQD